MGSENGIPAELVNMKIDEIKGRKDEDSRIAERLRKLADHLGAEAEREAEKERKQRDRSRDRSRDRRRSRSRDRKRSRERSRDRGSRRDRSREDDRSERKREKSGGDKPIKSENVKEHDAETKNGENGNINGKDNEDAS